MLHEKEYHTVGFIGHIATIKYGVNFGLPPMNQPRGALDYFFVPE